MNSFSSVSLTPLNSLSSSWESYSRACAPRRASRARNESTLLMNDAMLADGSQDVTFKLISGFTVVCHQDCPSRMPVFQRDWRCDRRGCSGRQPYENFAPVCYYHYCHDLL